MLHVNINGQPEAFPEGTTILRAARALGFEIPTLCHDERLRPIGACRLCSVEIRGWSRLAAACTTPLADGMEIQTDSPAVTNARETILSLLAKNYPESALGSSPENLFHRLLRDANITGNASISTLPDNSHPYIKIDMSRCIGCFRCVRVCD